MVRGQVIAGIGGQATNLKARQQRSQRFRCQPAAQVADKPCSSAGPKGFVPEARFLELRLPDPGLLIGPLREFQEQLPHRAILLARGDLPIEPGSLQFLESTLFFAHG